MIILEDFAMPNAAPIRETPARSPLRSPDQLCPPAADPAEPMLELDRIQGNILPGLMKDFQTLIFLRIADPQQFRLWLQALVPFIASAEEVLAFNRLFKFMR